MRRSTLEISEKSATICKVLEPLEESVQGIVTKLEIIHRNEKFLVMVCQVLRVGLEISQVFSI